MAMENGTPLQYIFVCSSRSKIVISRLCGGDTVMMRRGGGGGLVCIITMMASLYA